MFRKDLAQSWHSGSLLRSYLVSLVYFRQLPVEGLLAKVGKVAEREPGPIVHWFHGEAPCQLAVTLRVHQSKALEVPRSKVGRDLAPRRKNRGQLGQTHQSGQGTERCQGRQDMGLPETRAEREMLDIWGEMKGCAQC